MSKEGGPMPTPISGPSPGSSGFGRSRIITRRQLLRNAGAGVAGISLAAVLAACSKGSPSASGGAFDWSAQEEAGQFTFANWPFYIDKAKVNGETVHPSLERFTKDTGITVDYLEIIDDYASFFAKIKPLLAADRSTGFDVIVMGYPRWFPLMIALDYLIPLDNSLLPHFNANAADIFKDPPFDPNHRHGLPFASGMTGIGYNPDQTGREITSIMDLFDPAFVGKVGMFGDTEDMPNLTLLGMGVEPSDSTPSDWNAAADLLREQRDRGIVRKYYGQGYIGDLQSGDLALSMAWSPDIHQSNISGYPDMKFAVPKEGLVQWTDYLCIPRGAEHPLDAITYLDYVYKPEIAAMMTSWIGAIPPVPDAQDVLKSTGFKDIADSPLIFPTPDMTAQIHPYRVLSPTEQETWDETFLNVINGG
jgi:spermidine/putrescine transport system substrate-binding protein